MEDFNLEDENASVVYSAVTIQTQDVPNESTMERGKEIKISGAVDLMQHRCFFSVFPNGYVEETKGYVSVLLHSSNDNIYFGGICMVSLIDSSNNPRFSQTFAIPYPTTVRFVIDKFVSRKQLFNDPDDLIPNGILTIAINVQIVFFSVDVRDDKALGSLNFRYHFGNRPCELDLDSPLAKHLAKESKYFRAIIDTPMTEKQTRLMPIDQNEMGAFRDMATLLMGTNVMTFFSLKQIFDMYIVADKYDIPFVSDTCICFLKLYASERNVDELFVYTKKYKAEPLRELLEKEIDLISKTNLAEEIIKTDANVSLKHPVHKKLWAFSYPKKRTNTNTNLVFKNTATKDKADTDEKFDYHFYK